MDWMTRMAGRCVRIARLSPAPEHTASLLNAIGHRWHCWRLASESDRRLRFRLQLHLQTLAIVIEQDLTLLDGLERSEHSASDGNDR